MRLRITGDILTIEGARATDLLWLDRELNGVPFKMAAVIHPPRFREGYALKSYLPTTGIWRLGVRTATRLANGQYAPVEPSPTWDYRVVVGGISVEALR